MNATAQDAWAAGLFDGEGTIGVIRQQARSKRTGDRTFGHYVQIAVYAVHEPTLRRFQAFVAGGRIYRVVPKKGNPYFVWRSSCAAAVSVLKRLQPYLFTKIRQVALGLEAAALAASHKRGQLISREDAERLVEIATAIRHLNHPF